ncbi:MAG TPA: class D sortase [Acidimicrobiales bacterium]|nr:class D sortase [Acidimicrobiales bacterium]
MFRRATDNDSHTDNDSTGPPRRRRWGYRALIGVGVLLVASAVTWQVQATLWTTHSNRVGDSLVKKLENAQRQAARDATQSAKGTSAPCVATTAAGGPTGLLVIPAIGLTAPVEDGTDDAQLSVAVGHVPTSVWPGTNGNAVLEAHDVSYFVNIDQLKTGDTISYETPCMTYTYTVQSHQVIQQGSPVYNTPNPTLSLVTCWPTNALWFTPSRYLVTATEVQATANKGTADVAAVPSSAIAPTVPAPAALVSQGLTLATNSILMGTMSVSGQVDPTWVEGPGPLAVQGSAVQSFIGGIKALEQNQIGWWSALAPGVTAPAALVGAHVTGYDASLDVTVTATGTQASSVQLTDTATIAGGGAPGRYLVSVVQTVSQGQLLITSWTLHPA